MDVFIEQFPKYFNSLRKVEGGREIHLNLGLPRNAKPQIIDEQWDPEGPVEDLKEILGLEVTVTHFRPAAMQPGQFGKKWMTVAEVTLVIPKGCPCMEAAQRCRCSSMSLKQTTSSPLMYIYMTL